MRLLTTLLLSAVLQFGDTSEDSLGGQQANAGDQIDAIIRLNLEKRDLQPNSLVGDLQFFRRVYLDVIGRIPTNEELRSFYADTRRVTAKGKTVVLLSVR